MNTAEQLARLILAAAKLHEDSFDPSGYKVQIPEAVVSVASLDQAPFIQPATLLLDNAWNDALDWANEVAAAVDGPSE